MPRRVIDPPQLEPAAPAKTGRKAGNRLRPLYIPRAEVMTVKQAVFAFRAEYGLSEDTLRRLIGHYGIANRSLPGAPWRISAPALAMALDGDEHALELLRQDNRDHPDVQRYFVRLGIPVT